MKEKNRFDVIIVGGSYAGLSAAMALGRALRNVLVIDSGKPCNRYTPHSHNFITHDGAVPADIAHLAKQQVQAYNTVLFHDGVAVKGTRDQQGFVVSAGDGTTFVSKKVIFASGISDIFPDIPGLEQCWGKTVIHCPYCHGYEVRHKKTGILGNGEYAWDFTRMISNWTSDLTLFTNGTSTLTKEQQEKIRSHNINIIEKKVIAVDHQDGNLRRIQFADNTFELLDALYTKLPFEQACIIPKQLGCELTETGHLKVDAFQKTNIPGAFACGDNSHVMRTVSVATAAGTLAGAMANKEMIDEGF